MTETPAEAPANPTGTWGKPKTGGRDRSRLRRVAVIVGIISGLLAAISGVAAGAVIFQLERNITRTSVSTLEQDTSTGPLNILVVGSDSREGLSREELIDLTLGAEAEIDGKRSDTVLLVSILPANKGITVVSLPRDLEVATARGRQKLTETFGDGPDGVVTAVQENYGIPIHHYVEINVSGFLGAVEALGSVEICLDEPLRDAKSGADFDAGCHRMDGRQALQYVRSRQGNRGDFERIERQQIFLRAVVAELAKAGLLVDVPRLLNVVEEVAQNVTTDEGLTTGKMTALADEMRSLASAGLPMTFVPGYTAFRGRQNFVIPYAPGAIALFDQIEAGEPIVDRGSRETRADTAVVVWNGGHPRGANVLVNTLGWSGFRVGSGGRGSIDATDKTTVYALDGHEEAAERVAATLGAPLRDFPADLTEPSSSDVVVVAADDADLES